MIRASEETQMSFYQSGDDAARLLPVSFSQWEERAKDRLGAGPYGYVAGAAGAGDTLSANLAAFQSWRIRPKICCDVSKRHLTANLFGKKLPVPFLLAPIGVASILHEAGEMAVARAAASCGVPYILSNVSTASMEEVASVMGDSPRWFQLYPPKDPELARSFIRRAERAGYSAIVVTVDSTMLGWRERDLQNGYLPFLRGDGMGNYFSDPVFLSKLTAPPEQDLEAAVRLALSEGNNTCFTWRELDQLRQLTRLPLLLKGLTHPSDAHQAIESGVDGLIVSNHGGRQLDGAVATLDALPEICTAAADRVPVLMDSGIRRGADVLKALALGASAVLIGRPYAYALAVAGETGVRAVIENLTAELELQLAISGHAAVDQVDSTLLVRQAGCGCH